MLYFSVLKNPSSTRLLPAALDGISKYAHLVNIDFFRDLMAVLKHLMEREQAADEEDSDIPLRLQCIVTAFELLSGQGKFEIQTSVANVQILIQLFHRRGFEHRPC